MYTFDNLEKSVLEVTRLPAEEMAEFCGAAMPVECKKGQYLLREGEFCRRIWWVEKGYLRAYHTQDGLEITTGLHLEGSFVTNQKSLLKDLPSESFLAAAEPAIVYEFSRERMFGLYERFPRILDFGKRLLETISIAQEDHLNLFRLYSADERYRHISETQPELLQRVPLSYLSSYLGVARETLSRLRNKKTQ